MTDGFVAKLNSTASSLLFSTYLGGSQADSAYGVGLDGVGNVYVVGNTSSANFPVTAGVLQSALSGPSDIFATKLSPTGTGLYSTYLGGSGTEQGFSAVVDAAGTVYLTGSTG